MIITVWYTCIKMWILFEIFLAAGEAVRLWFLCPSDRRNAEKKVPRWHTILDGTRSYMKKTLWDGRILVGFQLC